MSKNEITTQEIKAAMRSFEVIHDALDEEYMELWHNDLNIVWALLGKVKRIATNENNQ